MLIDICYSLDDGAAKILADKVSESSISVLFFFCLLLQNQKLINRINDFVSSKKANIKVKDEQVKVFDPLIKSEGGRLCTSQITQALDVSNSTAKKTMVEYIPGHRGHGCEPQDHRIVCECYYCNDFQPSSDKTVYESHVVIKHQGNPSYPSLADLEKKRITPKGKIWET